MLTALTLSMHVHAALRGKSVKVYVSGFEPRIRVECPVRCMWSAEPGIIRTLLIDVDGQRKYKMLTSVEGPQYYPSLRAKEGEYRSTTSFKSDVPLTYLLYLNQFMKPRVGATALPAASFIARNCGSKNNREEWVRGLRRYIRVDGLSSCLHSAPWPAEATATHWYASKIRAMQKYKLHLAFENQNEDDYITEKLWLALESGTLPVFLGARNVRRHVPPHSVVVARDFSGPTALGRYLAALLKNETRYSAYHEWRKRPLPTWWVRKYSIFNVSSQCRTCMWARQRAEKEKWKVTLRA